MRSSNSGGGSPAVEALRHASRSRRSAGEKRRVGQPVGPDIVAPHRPGGAVALVEIISDVDLALGHAVHVGIIVTGEADRRELRVPRAPFVAARQFELVEQMVDLRARSGRGHVETVRRLRPAQMDALNKEVVLLRSAAEDGMVFEDQAAFRAAGELGIFVRRHQPGRPAADDHQIEMLGLRTLLPAGIERIANAVRGLHHRPGIAVGGSVIADTTIAGEGIGGRGRRVGQLRNEHRACPGQCAVDHVAARDRGVHAERVVFAASCCHDACPDLPRKIARFHATAE
jgi:hypothetical protein